MIDQKMNIRKKGAVNKSPTQPSQTLSASSKDDKTTTSSIDTLGLRSDEIMSKYFKIYFTINPATSAQYKLISNSGNFKIYQKLFKFTESNSMELLIIGKMMGVTNYELCHSLFDAEARRSWQSEFDDRLEVLEEPSEDTKIYYHLTKKIFMISPRLSVHASKIKKTSYDEALQFARIKDREVIEDQKQNRSEFVTNIAFDVQHPDEKKYNNPRRSAVRISNEVFFTCQTLDTRKQAPIPTNARRSIKKREHLETNFFYANKVNLGGWLPNNALTMVASSHTPKLMSSLERYIAATYTKNRHISFE